MSDLDLWLFFFFLKGKKKKNPYTGTHNIYLIAKSINTYQMTGLGGFGVRLCGHNCQSFLPLFSVLRKGIKKNKTQERTSSGHSCICLSHLLLLLPALPPIFSSFSSLSPRAAFVMPISPRHTIDTWGLQLCYHKS